MTRRAWLWWLGALVSAPATAQLREDDDELPKPNVHVVDLQVAEQTVDQGVDVDETAVAVTVRGAATMAAAARAAHRAVRGGRLIVVGVRKEAS